MPNWCDTTLAFFSESDSPQLDELYESLASLLEERDIVQFREVAKSFGYDPDKHEMGLRGELFGLEEPDENGFMAVYTETAWGPELDIWDALVRDRYPEIQYVFLAEEPGCELFFNSDVEGRYFKTKYSIDYTSESEGDIVYFNTEEELLEFANRLFSSSATTIEGLRDAEEKWEEENPDNWASIHAFEFD